MTQQPLSSLEEKFIPQDIGIDLKNAQPVFQFVSPLMLVYGRNGIGKSYFASQSTRPIFVDLDENIFELPVDSNRSFGIALNTFQDVLDLLTLLFNQEHGYKTVVIDSLSSLEKLIVQHVLAETGAKSLASFQYGQGYMMMIPLWEQFLQKLKNLRTLKGMTVIMLGHYKEKRDPNLMGESYLQYQLNLYDRAAQLLINCCSAVFFAHYLVEIKNEKTEFGQQLAKASASERVLCTDEGVRFLAKNTYGMPPIIPMEWSEVYGYVKQHYLNVQKSLAQRQAHFKSTENLTVQKGGKSS